MFNFRFYESPKSRHSSFLVDQMTDLSNEIIGVNVEFYEGKITQEEFNRLSLAKTRLLMKRKRQHRLINIF
jgi:hypothetical protein